MPTNHPAATRAVTKLGHPSVVVRKRQAEIVTDEYEPLAKAVRQIMSLAQSDPTMESPHWHFRTARGPEVEAAILALGEALRDTVGEE